MHINQRNKATLAVSACAFVLACAPAQAEKWLLVAGDPESSISIDTDSIAPSGGHFIQAWFRTSHPFARDSGTTPEFTYSSFRSLRLFDCRKKASDLLEHEFFSGEDASGELVKRQAYPRSSVVLTRVAAGTRGEIILKAACSLAKAALRN